MTDTEKQDSALNLEAQSLDELDRVAAGGNEPPESSTEANPEEPEELQPSRRCNSSHRELLNNHFPLDE